MEEEEVVRSIEVSGNKRVDDKKIRDNIEIRKGKELKREDIDDEVKRIFEMGMF